MIMPERLAVWQGSLSWTAYGDCLATDIAADQPLLWCIFCESRISIDVGDWTKYFDEAEPCPQGGDNLKGCEKTSHSARHFDTGRRADPWNFNQARL
jgi:hypothetical protein